MSTWKKINGCTNYSISNEGEVRNDKTGRILKPSVDTNGYLIVHIGGKVRRIHKLVADAFVPNPSNLPETNHKDGIKTNCHDWNLEWCTHRENVIHSHHVLGNKYKKEKRQVQCVETGEIFPTVEAAAKSVGRSSGAIRKCLYGRTKTAGGKHWRYYYGNQGRSNPGRKNPHSKSRKSGRQERVSVLKEQSVV